MMAAQSLSAVLGSGQAFEAPSKSIQLPNHALIVGGTQRYFFSACTFSAVLRCSLFYYSGKTYALLQILRHHKKIFNPPLSQLIYLYQAKQPCYEEIERQLTADGVECLFLRDSDIDIDSITNNEQNKRQILLIIDDAQEATSNSKNIADIATRGRHRSISLFLIW